MTGFTALPAAAQPLVGILPGESMNIDTAGVVVTASSNAWRITAPMRDDNGNASLGTSFRRWWHFLQASYPTSGVTADVRALENRWVTALKGRSGFAALRSTDPQSTLSGRPYVESMMHDRYTLEPEWDSVMAITFEGTYQAGPTAGVPNTADDYRRLGSDMGWAVADYYGISLAPITLFAASGATLATQISTG